jgi:hypothetical protein
MAIGICLPEKPANMGFNCGVSSGNKPNDFWTREGFDI